MISLSNALRSLRPGKEFTYQDSDLSTIVWNDSSVVTPSQEEINEEIERQAQENTAKKQAALSKIEALGLTPEDIRLVLE